jgi:hypothetical protein
MAARLDKETLIKQHFWILAGCFVILMLIPLLVLVTSVSATVEQEEKTLTDSKETVKRISDPKNKDWVEAYKTQDKIIADKKNKIWQIAWDHQKDMTTWPTPPENPGRWKNKYMYFGDPIDSFDAVNFVRDYALQYAEVFHVIQPVLPDKKGNPHGVVQFKGGLTNWDGVLQLSVAFKTPPSDEDIWLAQEDLWVKRELLRVIREANDAVARFKEVLPEAEAGKDKKEAKAEGDQAKPGAAPPAADQVKPAAPTAPSDPNHKRFRNPYWELDLTLAKDDKNKHVLRGTIKNISKRRQPLDTHFKVFVQGGNEPAFHDLHVFDEPLPVGKSLTIKDSPLGENLTIEGLFGVEQVLTWKTGPVKRLDRLELGYPSSRTATRTLKRPLWAKKADVQTGAPGDSATPGSPVNTGNADAGVPAGGKLSGIGGGYGGQDTATSKSGLALNRYTDVNEQVRHMPVGMAVIIDEDHIEDLLAAFANSVLRIQTTQYHWQHCREKIAPAQAEEAVATGTRPRPGGIFNPPVMSKPGPGARPPFGTDMEGMGGRRRPGGGVPIPSLPPGMKGGGSDGRGSTEGDVPGPGGFTVSPATEAEEELNLVEVAVYGIASLYERYPPKPPPQTTEASAAGADATKTDLKK